MALSVCLALAFTPVLADRTDRGADRSKAADRTVASDVDWQETVEPMVLRQNDGPREGAEFSTEASKATGLLARAQRAEGVEAISLLTQAVTLGLPENAETEKMLSEVYRRLGDLYEGASHKQVHWYSLAMQHTADPGVRAQLEGNISNLGGDAFAFAVTAPSQSTATTRTAGYCDNCGDCPVALDYCEILTISPPGDHDWFSFDVPGPDGMYVHIYTDSTDIYGDDTDLELWDACDGTQLYFDDDGGPGFLSLIDTGCLAPGTYHVAVGGWIDWSTPDDFLFCMEMVGTCELPKPDAYEDDDVREDANAIGHPTSVPLHASGWGRAKKEIQDHNIFPSGDPDMMSFKIERNEWVTMETTAQFGTFFNDFAASNPYDDPDTYLELLYGIEPNYGGFCNTPDIGWIYWCFTDADCEGLITNPLPGFPDCIPLQFFTVGGQPYWFWENPLAYNDDKTWGVYSSFLQICVPRGDQQTTSGTAAGDWLVRIWPYWLNDLFDYQVMVRNETPCDFEVEPNASFLTATPLIWGMISGITDQSNYDPNYGDVDLYSFDVEPPGELVSFETWGYDIYECDNAFELYVGPDDYGYYYFTGVSVDDCYGWLPCIYDLAMPPAEDLLENVYADADYFLNVTTWWLNKNFPYTLLSWRSPLPQMEAEPNDTKETANPVECGDNVLGGLHDYYLYGYCDYDNFVITVDVPTYMTFETDGGIDTTMALSTLGCEFLCCDDDSGYSLGSKIEACLPPGDYVVTLRGYGYWTMGSYYLDIVCGSECMPTSPITCMADWLYRCDGYGYSSSEEEYYTCPN
jgi:hypothetical protein